MCIYSGFEFVCSCVLSGASVVNGLFEFNVCKLVEGIKKKIHPDFVLRKKHGKVDQKWQLRVLFESSFPSMNWVDFFNWFK